MVPSRSTSTAAGNGSRGRRPAARAAQQRPGPMPGGRERNGRARAQHLEHLGAVPGAGSDPAPAEVGGQDRPIRRRPPRRPPAAQQPATGTVSANALVSRWNGRRPNGASARRRQSRPCTRSIRTSSALPRCWRRLAHHPRRAYRMSGVALALRQPIAGVQNPERQVGVLPEGPREPLVEPADQAQHVAAVGHVRGDPPRRLQPGRAPLPVGGAAIRRQRHGDPALNAGHGRRLVQVPATSASQFSETTTSSSRNATQSVSVARQPTLRAAAGPRPPLCSTVTSASRGESGGSSAAWARPIVDDEDAGQRDPGDLRGLPQAVEQHPQGRPADRRDDDDPGGAAGRRAVAHTSSPSRPLRPFGSRLPPRARTYELLALTAVPRSLVQHVSCQRSWMDG